MAPSQGHWIYTHKFPTMVLQLLPDRLKRKKQNRTLCHALEQPHLNNATIEYMDPDVDDFILLEDDTRLSDLGDKPSFRVMISEATFPLHRIYNHELGRFRRTLKLRDPQRLALEHIKAVWVDEPDADADVDPQHNRFMAVLPTGCGKTMLLALAPFVVRDAKRILVMVPNLTLRTQVATSLEQYYSPKSAIGREINTSIRVRSVGEKMVQQPLSYDWYHNRSIRTKSILQMKHSRLKQV
eukprot:m.46227 g.46227  ORF g.46227 m.46227 type:complete len:240 (-) comp13128_c0_seq1:121-840(-)